jgi:hypothetical protein
MLALNLAPLRLDWKATRSIEPVTRGVGEGVDVSVAVGMLVGVELGVSVEVGATVEMEVGVGDGGGALPQALKIKAAVVTRIALDIVHMFILSSLYSLWRLPPIGLGLRGTSSRKGISSLRSARRYHPRRGRSPQGAG